LSEAQMARACARLDALAARFPVEPVDYAAHQRTLDDALMRRAWAQGLTALGGAQPPALDRRLRVFTQRSVPSDGVSEAGPSGALVASLFAGFADAAIVELDDLQSLDWSDVPRDGCLNVLVTNHRGRYRDAARSWRPDLHLSLWNPFQALDVAAPTVVTWGYAEGAIDALRAWLEGRGPALGRSPVQLTA
jgi:beta-N-acetylhexosaminidase